jgi:hypothetical protein
MTVILRTQGLRLQRHVKDRNQAAFAARTYHVASQCHRQHGAAMGTALKAKSMFIKTIRPMTDDEVACAQDNGV